MAKPSAQASRQTAIHLAALLLAVGLLFMPAVSAHANQLLTDPHNPYRNATHPPDASVGHLAVKTGTSGHDSTSPIQIPEPATIILVGSGLVGAAVLRWRSRDRR